MTKNDKIRKKKGGKFTEWQDMSKASVKISGEIRNRLRQIYGGSRNFSKIWTKVGAIQLF